MHVCGKNATHFRRKNPVTGSEKRKSEINPVPVNSDPVAPLVAISNSSQPWIEFGWILLREVFLPQYLASWVGFVDGLRDTFLPIWSACPPNSAPHGSKPSLARRIVSPILFNFNKNSTSDHLHE